MSITLFISDLHLATTDTPNFRLFNHFIANLPLQTHKIYILGDWFNYWIGDDLCTELTSQVTHLISATTQAGIECYFMPGNRDFLLGKNFAQLCGIHILPDPFPLNLYGYRIVLTHGDALSFYNKNYLYYRRFVQHPLTKKLFLQLPLNTRQKIAKFLRQHSNPAHYDPITPQEAAQFLQTWQADLLIHGHTHIPAIHDLADNKKRIVLGDWHQKAKILKFTPEGYSLEEIFY